MVEPIAKNTEFLLLVKQHISVIHVNSYQDIEQGKVIKVIDGDGLLVSMEEETLNIRLAYVDSPEHHQEYGLESKQWLEKQLSNTSSVISIRFIDFDEKHERNIADVFINGYSLSWLMVATGNAWAYYDFLTNEVEQCYIEAQYFARKYRLGLWTNNLFPTPPWIYRAEQKGKQTSLRVEPARILMAVAEAMIDGSDEEKSKIIAEAKLQIEFNRNYYPMRYFHQVCLDHIKYAAIVCNSINWDIQHGYNGLEGDEVNIPFFQLALKASQGDEEAAYEYESWKRALYKAVGKVHLPEDYEKRLTQEWVECLTFRVENWVNQFSTSDAPY
ncbi:thermonuclease family protein [Anabaena sp. 4-3]|uniref:thermonuclease family protein n=1 Tax=Anabaena sp. 4-3 TaxID=1811979 RepID=UPI00082E5A28|nr:thermonuclease family protein [Anabaena sp. 4-3]